MAVNSRNRLASLQAVGRSDWQHCKARHVYRDLLQAISLLRLESGRPSSHQTREGQANNSWGGLELAFEQQTTQEAKGQVARAQTCTVTISSRRHCAHGLDPLCEKLLSLVLSCEGCSSTGDAWKLHACWQDQDHV